MAQDLFYTFGAIFFVLLSILLIIVIFVSIYISNEIKRLNRKVHFTMQNLNGILENGLGYIRTAQLGLAGSFLKRLLNILRKG